MATPIQALIKPCCIPIDNILESYSRSGYRMNEIWDNNGLPE